MEENKNTEEEKSAAGNAQHPADQELAENIPAAGPGGQEIISADETSMPEAEAATAEQQQIEQSEIPMTIGTTNNKQQTEEMEVHHHTHAAPGPDSHRGKNWKTYFWEFLMLFLAVFCGFLAEYQLEHKIEKDRVKEYAEFFLEDLKNDSVYVNQLLTNQQQMLLQADSLLSLLTSDQFLNNNYQLVNHFNKLSVFVDFNPAFPVNFEQVKNSGSLRYFKNKKLVSSMSTLNREMEIVEEVYKGYNGFIEQYLTPFSINHLNTLQYDIFSRKVLVSDPAIYGWNKEEALLLANKINRKRTYDIFFINRFLKGCGEKITALSISIKKEYQLK